VLTAAHWISNGLNFKLV